MTKKIFFTLMSFCLMMLTCISMFIVKYEVVKAEDELYQLNRQIISYQKEIHILKAELAHLTDPKRLRKIAKKYTKLEEIKPFQVISLSDLAFQGNNVKKVSYK